MKKTLILFVVVLLSLTAVMATEKVSKTETATLGLSVRILEVFRAIDLTKEQAATLYEGLMDAKAKMDEMIGEKTELLEKLREALINDNEEQIKRIHEALNKRAEAFGEIQKSVITLFKENITLAQAEKLKNIIQRNIAGRFQKLDINPEVLRERVEQFKENPRELAEKLPEPMKEKLMNMTPEEKERALKEFEARAKGAMENMKQKSVEMKKKATIMKKEIGKKIGRLIFSPVFLDTLKDYAGIE
ncbi:hypothetical protein AT15_05045 [Kosmotoga arenicorallina S304]|uniref:DUF5667 domain-containing protein n=1 Tax=Kosmotoga arenicorallina S304 TaxID=1453497 RepID=A0A176JVJ4_9BACT|nr:hypothetical protein [Kosmotoga arenicorallina]OAA27586.1 hypothetical protein AT15_05045 [Kosmotoga arenicorallina S304]